MLAMEILPPSILERPLLVPNKTLMGPGPTNFSQRVLDAMSNPAIGHMHPECLQIMDEIKEGLKYLFQTKNNVTMCISASGHGGLEAALCNILEDGDVILLGVNGIWGHKAGEIAMRYGADVRFVEAKLGHSLSIEEIKFAFEGHRPKVFFITHGDSSTGIFQSNIKQIGDLCKKYDCLLVVDVVASLGATEFLMDNWNVDIAYCASQKVLGAPPGLAPISFSRRAMSRISSRKSKVKVYYWDVNLLGQYWNCFGTSRIYHHTISSPLLYGLREALSAYCSLGLKAVIHKHQTCALRLHQGIENMGLELFVPNASDRLPTITAIKVPNGVDWMKVSEYAMRKYVLEISGGLGPTAGQVFRIGLMGENATTEKVDLALVILKEALQNSSPRFNMNERSKM